MQSDLSLSPFRRLFAFHQKVPHLRRAAPTVFVLLASMLIGVGVFAPRFASFGAATPGSPPGEIRSILPSTDADKEESPEWHGSLSYRSADETLRGTNGQPVVIPGGQVAAPWNAQTQPSFPIGYTPPGNQPALVDPSRLPSIQPAGAMPNAAGPVGVEPRIHTDMRGAPPASIFTAPATSAPPQPATTTAQSIPVPQDFESAQILARVGSETILASDILPLAEEAIQSKLREVPEDQRSQIPPEQLQALKRQYVKLLLQQLVEVKIRYADAVANIPKENLPQVKASINQSFDKSVLKKLMEKYQATTRSELEAKMAADGQSLDRQRQMYLERSLASGWESQHIKENRQVPLSEQVGYYQQNIAQFSYPAKARWEQLMVSFDRFNSRPEAERALAEMGNDVLRGAPFAEVAKLRSHGPTRFDGGIYDWTTKGSLVSKVLDEAIFGLPVGSMSQILEDENGYHIVRVIERVDAGRKEFLEAQTEIRKKLRDQDIERQTKEFVEKMKSRTPVWTIFDDQPGNSSSATAAAPDADVIR
jgi:parvulin-like peptidyl-prolyl isomerase